MMVAGEGVMNAALVRKLRLVTGIVAIVALVLDQISKQWVLTSLLPCLSGPAGPECAVNSPFIEVTGFFNMVVAWNFGVSFSMFYSQHDLMPFVLSLLAIGICGALLWWNRRNDRGLVAVATGMVIGGAIGNVIDRFRFGAVADFLDFHVAGWHWPAFNVADCCIVVGVGLLLIDGLFSGDERR
jgi:signal peptidase II